VRDGDLVVDVVQAPAESDAGVEVGV
jgi:hypothetical protein